MAPDGVAFIENSNLTHTHSSQKHADHGGLHLTPYIQTHLCASDAVTSVTATPQRSPSHGMTGTAGGDKGDGGVEFS